jgi:S1-C subfamily serine protease
MSNALSSFSDALAAAVEAVSPGVVRVEARRRLPATGVVWSADGIIVTAHHVVEDSDNITIGLPDGKTVAARLVGRDASTDVAVLRADASGLTVPAWADDAPLKVGHLVLALGRPGEDVSATTGIISALGGGWRTPAGGSLDRYLQTDVVMYPGFSGGPLVGAEGQVLGINTSALLRGVSVTVPTSNVRKVAAALLAHGHIRRGYLGVGAQPVRLPRGVAQAVGQETGLLLASVEADSPAERGGLLLGDTIVAFAGQPMRQVDDLLVQLNDLAVGAVVPVRVLRGGQVLEMSVTIGERS